MRKSELGTVSNPASFRRKLNFKMAMNLLQEIINESVAKDTDVPRVLRLSLALASKLKNEPFKAWVLSELEGYPADVQPPPYRSIRARNRGHFEAINFRGTIDLPLSVLPEKLQPHYERAFFRDSIAECADLLTNRKGDGSSFQIPWPVELAVKYGSKAVTHGQCLRAWMEVSPSELFGMLDKVKTKILAFALEIEELDPTAGDIQSPSAVRLTTERVTQVFNTTIIGGQNIAVGNESSQQAAVSGVEPGNLESLVAALTSIGVAPKSIEDLKAAIESDTSKGDAGFGGKAKQWLADLGQKAASKVAEKGVDVVGNAAGQGFESLVTLAENALKAYFSS